MTKTIVTDHTKKPSLTICLYRQFAIRSDISKLTIKGYIELGYDSS